MAEKPKYTQPDAYKSQYQGQIDSTLNSITNREAFSYDPLKDASYQALAKIYGKQGEQAAKNTMGDAASLNGGYGSSYAVTASQQARNNFNQQLASQIPALQEAAYNRYLGDYNIDISALNALQAADDSAYGKYRDTVSDSQWKYGMDYQGYRDDVADSQWEKTYKRSIYESDRDFNYQKSRDDVADRQWRQTYDRSVYESDRDYNYQKTRDKVSDSQWNKTYSRSVYESNRDYNYQKKQDTKNFNYQKSRDKTSDKQWAQEFALQKKSAAASGRGSSSGGGNGYYGATSSSDSSISSDNYSLAELVARGVSAAEKTVPKAGDIAAKAATKKSTKSSKSTKSTKSTKTKGSKTNSTTRRNR